ncbi:MAG: hypothetical protein ACI83P_001088, partial [Janthinobacterium sp.]
MSSLFAYLALLAGLMPTAFQLELLGAPLILISILASWRDLKRVSRSILGLALLTGLSALLWGPQTLMAAAANTARLTTLVIAVMLLSATLGASRDLETLSASLFSGQPLSRYLGVTFATGVLAIALNFGAVGVMSTLIGRVIGLRGDCALTRNAARAVLRGFAFASMCSPLSVSIVITLTFLPDLPGWHLIGVGLPCAIGYLLLGALFRDDESAQGQAQPQEQNAGATQARMLAWLRFALYIGAICTGAFGLSGFGEVPYSRAVAISCVTAVAVGLLFRRLRGAAIAL